MISAPSLILLLALSAGHLPASPACAHCARESGEIRRIAD